MASKLYAKHMHKWLEDVLQTLKRPTIAVFCDHDHKINCFPGIIVEHLYVKFGDPRCSGFLRYRADKQTNGGVNPTPCDCHWHG